MKQLSIYIISSRRSISGPGVGLSKETRELIRQECENAAVITCREDLMPYYITAAVNEPVRRSNSIYGGLDPRLSL